MEGLSAREAAVDFVAQEVRPDGVISTKAALVRRAKAKGLLTVYRTFMIDSMALSALLRADALASADFVETLPGTMPKIIRTVRRAPSPAHCQRAHHRQGGRDLRAVGGGVRRVHD